MTSFWQRSLELFASRKLLNITLPAIMAYLVIGTVAQKSVGLYVSTHRYFMAPFVPVGGVPLPGMPIFIALLVLNLMAHLWLKASTTRQRTGTVLTHVGVILLLVSALMTSLLARDGYVDLREGEQSDYVSDYHKRVVVVRDLTQRESYVLPFEALEAHRDTPQMIAHAFSFRVRDLCRNCGINPRTQPAQNAHGMARGMQLASKPSEIDNEANMAGLSFTVEGTDQDGLYTALENIPTLPSFRAKGHDFSIAIEKQRRRLPFSITLLQTDRHLYPGTEEAKAYRSRVRIRDGAKLWEADLSLNQPVRYKGYALFQSSYIEDAQGRRSVIAVVHNPIRMFPYIAGAMISLGMIWHMMRRRSGLAAALVLMVSGMVAPPAHAAMEGYDLQAFGRLPVQSDGRVRPLASVAAERLAFISGTEADAVKSFATILFHPDKADRMPLIRVESSGARSLLELPAAPGHRYPANRLGTSFIRHKALVASLLGKNPRELTEEQRQLVNAYERYESYRDLAQVLDAYRPLAAFPVSSLPRAVQKKLGREEIFSFAESMPAHAFIEQQTRALVKRKGAELQHYTPEEQALSYLAYVLSGMRAAGEQSRPLNLVHDVNFAQFTSPWAIVLEGSGGPGFAASLAQWRQLVEQANEPAAWNKTVRGMQQGFLPPLGFWVELYAHAVPWLKLAISFYALALVAFLAAFTAQRSFTTLPFALLAVGMAAQATDVITRIVILGRPPVGTLYESILFAGLVMTAAACWRFTRTRESFWLWLAASGGCLLALLAYANRPEPGTPSMLTAVLNTNFWLTTHVLTITAGYAFSILTALLAHRLLLLRAIPEAAYTTLKRAALLALIFCATGTMLGGIWADQSWGRFWGWDPKENGALLIVLWLVWFLHGEVTRSMPRWLVVTGLALLSIVVAVSWFGVNLLNIGLHSYGFTQGMQWGLILFAAVELAWIGAFALRLRGATA